MLWQDKKDSTHFKCYFRITLEHVKHILQILLPIKKIAPSNYNKKQELDSAQRE